jgi:signal transduction histidine kinase
MTGAIRDETRRINTIIENFLSYARTPGFHFEKTNLDQFILQNLPALRAVPGLNLTTFIPEKIQLTIDHDQIMQVLINLLRNSAESRSGVVEVIITAQEKDGRISLIVQDDGPGIPAENQDKVFDLYFTGKEMGNGLGLAIVEKIISAHGGRVRIQSPVKNEAGQTGGTAVILDLPGEVQVENE